MSYNPNRLEKNREFQQRNAPPLGSGTDHSAIMKKYAGSSSGPVGDRTRTLHGYSISLFACVDFVTRYEIMHDRNNTGLGINTDANRTIMVLRGTLYAMIENDKGILDTVKFPEGNYLHLPYNTKYGLATSGVEGAELYITETPDYAKTWKQLEPPTVGEVLPMPEAAVMHAPTIVRRGPDPRTVLQAQEMAIDAEQRRQAAVQRVAVVQPGNANSANTTGVSPRPSGPPRGEEG